MAIKLFVTDLDDTLWNWFETWHVSFSAMLDEIVEISGFDRDQLEREIRLIHQNYGTSEYSNTVREIPSLLNHYGDEQTVRAEMEPAVVAYREARQQTLRLYPGVKATLAMLREAGIRIVAYSDSLAYYTAARIKALDLDGLIDVLYTPPDHDGPGKGIHRSGSGRGQLRVTEHRILPPGVRKPQPQILLDIVKEEGVGRSEVLYLGDSLLNDISMANDAKVPCALAAYKKEFNDGEYELLQRVSHWTDEKVDKEKSEDEGAMPDFVISDIEALVGLAGLASDASLDRQVEVWKTIVDVQKHFNDIEMRIRNFAVTVLAAMSTAAAVAVREQAVIALPSGWVTSLGTAILTLATFVWLSFYYVDGHWYHPLLKASVDQGRNLERRLSTAIPGIGLAEQITLGSNSKNAVKSTSERNRSKKKNRSNSTKRLNRFYFSIAAAMLLAAVGAHIAANVEAPAAEDTEPLVVRIESVDEEIPNTSTESNR